MPELEERFADALHGTARIWRQAIDRRLKNLGMSQASWMTIAVASKARSPLSQSELAERLGVEGATMVAMVDRLAKAGFVVRQPCQGDRRINRVVLTEEGNRLCRDRQSRGCRRAQRASRRPSILRNSRSPPSCSRRCKD